MNVHDAPHRRLGDPDVYATTHVGGDKGMVEGRVRTRDTLTECAALRQSPATKSRLAGVGMAASLIASCNSSIELAILAKIWAAFSSVRIRDQPASVSRTVKALTALAAARSAAVRETLQRGRKALTAWKVLSWTRAPPPGPCCILT